jgi:hypothetical protein
MAPGSLSRYHNGFLAEAKCECGGKWEWNGWAWGHFAADIETDNLADDCLTDSEMDELRYGQEDPQFEEMQQNRREETMEAQR